VKFQSTVSINRVGLIWVREIIPYIIRVNQEFARLRENPGLTVEGMVKTSTEASKVIAL
jgi:hypothetical protein